jgi:hypothetical protein
MRVFISWSGDKARRVAIATKSFLQDVNQRTTVWFSDADIVAGQRWSNELSAQLDATNYGIICVTQESVQSPWVLFEAGALSKSVAHGLVCPYLIDVTRSDLSGPLSQFQAKECTREQTWEMLTSVNLAMTEDALVESRLRRYFDTYWPELEEKIALVNQELRPLPPDIVPRLLNTLPSVFYDVRRVEFLAQTAGVSVWKVNLNQAAIYVWRELIQVAITERRLTDLLERTVGDAPALSAQLDDVIRRVQQWTRDSLRDQD